VTYARIVPLGGLGEVGMNCLAVETPGGVLVVDCGVMFPHDDLGIDVMHPDFTYLWERRDEIVGVVITHGHEDHIGGLPYLLRQIPVPVWAPPYALALIRARLAEHPEVPVPTLHATTPRVRFDVGPFGVEPLRVTHSIPDALAFAIDTPAGRVFHTGDFKLDPAPLDGEPADEDRFRELGDDGVAVLLSDSTNVDVPGRAARERDVAATLRARIASLDGRVIVGLFASNVVRLQSLADIAVATGRRLCLLGRSVQTHARAATELGRFRVPSDRMVSADHVMSLPPGEVLAIASGTQAEPGSAIARLARGDHPRMRLERGDSVVFSSRAIPGNERKIFDLVCALERRGVEVHVPTADVGLHASGHAAREEQARMIELVRPRSFVPVHGTYHHLKRHAELARELGVDTVMLVENGRTARWSSDGLASGGTVPHGRVAVDEGVELSEETLRERAAMAAAGVVFATVPLDERGGLAGMPVVAARGVVLDDPPEVVTEAARIAIDESLRQARGSLDRLDDDAAEEAARRALRRMYRVGDKRPLVVVEVVRRSGGGSG
jgi:ribonuclease J